MALAIMKWDNSESAIKLSTYGSTDGYVEFKDEDFGIPGNIKRWYGIRLSYLTHGTPVAKTAIVSYALDGASAFGTTGVPSGSFDAGSAVVGDDMTLSAIQSCQSVKVRFEFDHVDGIYELRDVGLELRPIHKRVT